MRRKIAQAPFTHSPTALFIYTDKTAMPSDQSGQPAVSPTASANFTDNAGRTGASTPTNSFASAPTALPDAGGHGAGCWSDKPWQHRGRCLSRIRGRWPVRDCAVLAVVMSASFIAWRDVSNVNEIQSKQKTKDRYHISSCWMIYYAKGNSETRSWSGSFIASFRVRPYAGQHMQPAQHIRSCMQLSSELRKAAKTSLFKCHRGIAVFSSHVMFK